MEKLGPPMQLEQRFSLDTQAHFRQTSHSKISNIKDYGLIEIRKNTPNQSLRF